MQTIDPINRSKETGGDGVKKKKKKRKEKTKHNKNKETEINEIYWGSNGNQVDNPTWFDATLDQPWWRHWTGVSKRWSMNCNFFGYIH